jgi:hypothetical protein
VQVAPRGADPDSTQGESPMSKVRLEIGQLEVQSFETLPVRPGRGTVHGNAYEVALDLTRTNKELDCAPLSRGCPVTVLATCPDTCQNTCLDTCDINCTALCSIGCTESLSDCRFTGDPVCCV